MVSDCRGASAEPGPCEQSPSSSAPRAPGSGTVTAGTVKASGGAAVTVALRCAPGGASGTVTLELTTRERVTRGSGKHRKTVTLTVVVGRASKTLASGATATAKLALNATGRRLLAKEHTLNATLLVLQTVAGKTKTLFTKQVVFRSAKR